MGQYYKVVNVTKKQYLNPHEFGDGLKLMEFGISGCGTMAGLAILLANSNGRGGGDLDTDNPIVGTWAGDRIVIAGDYATAGDPGEDIWTDDELNLYSLCNADPEYEDISMAVVSALCDDSYVDQMLGDGLY